MEGNVRAKSSSVAQTAEAEATDPPETLASPSFSPRLTDLASSNEPFGDNSVSGFLSDQVDACIPRKYRLNTRSLSRDLHLWNAPNEPSLHQILEQERNAWLAHSPTNDSPSSSQSTHKLHGISGLATSGQHGSDHASRSSQTQTSPALPVQYLDTPNSQLKRKSCFQEGSMTQGSKGVASSWNMLHSSSQQDHDHESTSLDLSDAESTPRATATSRTSTCSSIDINEFKPLPATPSTFRNTIKRLGQRVTNTTSTPFVEQTVSHSMPEKKQKGGLRKSLSTWKIFTNTTSDQDDHVLTTDDESRTRKKSKASRTLRSQKPQTDDTSSQKAILDERKRKAEIAYGEQFGSTRKRQRQVHPRGEHDEPASDCDAPTDSATVRRRTPSRSSTIRTVKSVLRKPIHKDEASTSRSELASSPRPLPVPGAQAASRPRTRSQVQALTREADLHADRLKKQSRSELEKENQHLRLMLRGKEAEMTAEKSAKRTHGRGGSDLLFHEKSPTKIASITKDEQTRKEVLAAVPTDVTPLNAIRPLNHPSTTLSKPSTSGTAKTSRGDTYISDDIPPVPLLPGKLQPPRVLVPSSNNIQVFKETTTIKRRGPACKQNGQPVFPRPLSMVLEGIEYVDENNEEQTKGRLNSQLDGVGNDEHDRDEENRVHAGHVQPSHNSGTRVHPWDWPEDVF